MKAAFYTLGCKVNQYETEAMAERLAADGFEIVPFEEQADVYIVNTCTVTAVSDKKSRQLLHRAGRRNPDALIVAAGCYPQAAKHADALPPECDLIIGNAEKERLPELIRAALGQRARTVAVSDIGACRAHDAMRISHGDRTRVHLKIQDGCNHFCSYCIIPYARGRVRSKPVEAVRTEFAGLLRAGYPEIVLTGIEIASYGADIGSSLSELLPVLDAEAAAFPGARIRLGSLEPRLITPEFVAVLLRCPSVCPHFHLSLQSGCDRILKRMNRKYDTARYLESVRLLREAFPLCAVTTDIIAGFPGETEEDFAETLAFVETVGFARVHVFPYSRREGTPAARMPGQLTAAEKQRRAQALIARCEEVRLQFLRHLSGQQMEVLLEQREGPFMMGHTANYTPVYLESSEDLAGRALTVILREPLRDGLRGESVPKPE